MALPRAATWRAWWLGALASWVTRALFFTLDIVVVEHPALAQRREPFVLAFLHGQQLALLAWKRRRPTLVLVSLSRDGELQAQALARAGMIVKRGSTSRGGVRGLAAIVRALRDGKHDAAFAVDGPRGPYGVVHPGAAMAARAVSGMVVPMASACASAFVLNRAWDRFEIPRPFSRVFVVLGPPLAPANEMIIGNGIDECRAIAEAGLKGVALAWKETP